MNSNYGVLLTGDAERDLEVLHAWMMANRSPDVADGLLEDLLTLIASMENMPERGSIPKELEQLGITEFRQMLLPPYRLVYRITRQTVIIMLIADGRRDMQTILRQRLLRPPN